MNIRSIFGEFPIFTQLRQSQEDADTQRRLFDYKEMSDMYYGRHWNHIRVDDEDLVTVNFCETFVDKLTSFLASSPWSFDDEDEDYNKRLREYVLNVWDANNKDVTTYEYCQQSSLYGDAFMFIVKRDTEELPKFVIVPPMYVFPEWHPESDEMMSAEIAYAHEKNKKELKVQYFLDKMSIRKVVNGVEEYNEIHGLGKVPLVHLVGRKQVGKWNGRSDIHSIVPVQRHLNDKLTDMSDIIAYHSSPMTFVFGTRLENIEKGADKLISGLPTDATVQNVTFDSDMAGSNNYVHDIKKYMHQLVGVPEIAFGSVDDLRFSNSSGLAIQMLYQPMLDILKVKRLYLTKAIKEINEITLLYAQMNFTIEGLTDEEILEFRKSGILYESPLPQDETANIQNVLVQADKGILHPVDMYKQLGKKNPAEYHAKVKKAREDGELMPYEQANQPPQTEQSPESTASKTDGDTENGET